LSDEVTVVEVAASVTVRVVDAVDPVSLPSPEYVAMIVWLPTARNVEGAHESAGRVATHSVELPETNVTVPEAVPGSPVAARVALVPNGTLDGVALAVIDVGAEVTVSDVEAVELA
jgi:hypothetical protein